IIAFLFLSCVFIFREHIQRVKYLGLGLWIPHFLLLVPFMKYILYSVPVLLMALIPAYLVFRQFKDGVYSLMVFGHALDGAATFFIIDFFSGISGIPYGEQHVISRAVGELLGTFFVFYILKVAISLAAVYILAKEKMEREDKIFFALIIITIGLAPGIRDVLRMVVGA
ncbi:DUF63 family protein, partial [Candidatus Micrarchaeota archaeon]|nr:DUF63 family protein [Candidatus Micrarchaeota archaeon]